MFTYVILDLETTGLSVEKNRIVSIAAKVFNTGYNSIEVYNPNDEFISTTSVFRAFVNPNQKNHAEHINNIKEDLLLRSDTFEQVMTKFWDWMLSFNNPNIVLIGHNIDFFDEPFLIHECIRCGIFKPQFLNLYRIDTMKLCKFLYPITVKNCPYKLTLSDGCPESYRQAAIFEYLFHIPPPDQHDALGDVLALERILNTNLFRDTLFRAVPDVSNIR